MKYTILLSLSILIIPWAVSANETVIVNDIQVKSSTGGNKGQNIDEGKAEASVKIFTQINGETVINKEYKTTSTSTVSLEVENEVSLEKGKLSNKESIKSSAPSEVIEKPLAVVEARVTSPLKNERSVSSQNPETISVNSGAELSQLAASQTILDKNEIIKDDIGPVEQEDQIVEQVKTTSSNGTVAPTGLWSFVVSLYNKIFNFFRK